MKIALLIFGSIAFGFFAAALFTSRSLAVWRDRCIGLTSELIRHGHIPPRTAMFDQRRILARSSGRRLKRRTSRGTTIAWSIITLGAVFWNYIFLNQPGDITLRTILIAAICGVWSGIGAWCIAIRWPERKPQGTEFFINNWAMSMPGSLDYETRFRFIFDVLQAAGLDLSGIDRTRTAPPFHPSCKCPLTESAEDCSTGKTN